MRTTLNLDDDVLAAARALAHAQGRPLGRVVSDLVRQGLEPSEARLDDDGFPAFSVVIGAPPITSDMVAVGLEEL